jgi:predicted GNAT family N-acyltransferase
LIPDKESVHQYIGKIREMVSANKRQEKILEKLMKKDISQSSSEFNNLTKTLSVVKLRDIYKKYLQLKRENN